MRVHSILGPGFLEAVYRNALARELRRRGVDIELEKQLQVRYEDEIVGDFVADLLIADCIIAESKAVSALVRAHEAQLINYLAATGIELGLLISFGGRKLEVRRRTRDIAAARVKNRSDFTG